MTPTWSMESQCLMLIQNLSHRNGRDETSKVKWAGHKLPLTPRVMSYVGFVLGSAHSLLFWRLKSGGGPGALFGRCLFCCVCASRRRPFLFLGGECIRPKAAFQDEYASCPSPVEGICKHAHQYKHVQYMFCGWNVFPKKIFEKKWLWKNDVIFENIRFVNKNMFFAQKHYFWALRPPPWA